MASRQNSTRQGQAKKGPPKGDDFDLYMEAIEEMDSETLLEVGRANFEDMEEEYGYDKGTIQWTNLTRDGYMELLDLINQKIEEVATGSNDEYILKMIQLIARFRMYLPQYFIINKMGIIRRFDDVRDHAVKKLSAEGLERAHQYAGKRKAKVSKAKKSLKKVKSIKKSKKHSKKTKKSRR
jgi:hypothetical protein